VQLVGLFKNLFRIKKFDSYGAYLTNS